MKKTCVIISIVILMLLVGGCTLFEEPPEPENALTIDEYNIYIKEYHDEFMKKMYEINSLISESDLSIVEENDKIIVAIDEAVEHVKTIEEVVSVKDYKKVDENIKEAMLKYSEALALLKGIVEKGNRATDQDDEAFEDQYVAVFKEANASLQAAQEQAIKITEKQ